MEKLELTLPSQLNYKTDDNNVVYDVKNKELMMCYGYDLEEYEIKKGTKVISDNAFEGICKLKKIELPQSLHSINERAFQNCDNLNEINLPNGLEEIQDLAFNNCEKIISVFLPASIENLGIGIFNDCINLKSFEIDMLNKNFVIEDGVIFNIDRTAIITTIPSLIKSSYRIPDSVKKINDNAFFNCKELITIYLSEYLTEIGNYAFNKCTSLIHIIPRNRIATLSNGCFSNTSIDRFTIPASVSKIGIAPFAACHKLSKIDVEPENLLFKSIDGVLFSKNGTTLINYPTGSIKKNYSTPNSTEEISNGAFKGSKHIQQITISSKINCINNSAFSECPALCSVWLPNNIYDIQEFAFEGCISLKQINLPEGLKYIKSWAFRGCKNLSNITMPSSLVSIEEHAFCGGKNITFEVSTDNPYFISINGKLFESRYGFWAINDNINHIEVPF